MNSLSLILGYIVFFSLFVWVFIANDLYLKVFFLKGDKKRLRRQRENNVEEIFFEQAYGGQKVPQYIKNPILNSQDKLQLLALYLASQNIVDVGLYQKIIVGSTIDRYKECAKYISKTDKRGFNNLMGFLRISSIIIFIFLMYVFLSHVFFNVDHKIQSNDQFICLSVLCLFILMPYKVYSEHILLNRVYALCSFMSSIILSCFTVIYFYNYSGFFVFDKFLFSVTLSSLIIFLGAYSYVGYMKIEYLVKFFELLEINNAYIKQNKTENQAA